MGEPGLIHRVFQLHDDYVDVIEQWDLTVPGCPVVALAPDAEIFVQRKRITRQEYMWFCLYGGGLKDQYIGLPNSYKGPAT